MPDLVNLLRTGPVEIVQPELVITQAAKVGIPLAVACALPQQESLGKIGNRVIAGRNVFGHDRVDTGGFYVKGAEVTEVSYRKYSGARKAGKIKTQGVGWLQLTWYEFQDEADRLGGCWRTDINLLVGYRIFNSYLNKMNFWNAAKKYNGKAIYADQITPKFEAWDRHLKTAPKNKSHIILLGG